MSFTRHKWWALGNGTAGYPALGRHNLPGKVPSAPEGMRATIAGQILHSVGEVYGALHEIVLK